MIGTTPKSLNRHLYLVLLYTASFYFPLKKTSCQKVNHPRRPRGRSWGVGGKLGRAETMAEGAGRKGEGEKRAPGNKSSKSSSATTFAARR